jgi:hypothetical protein
VRLANRYRPPDCTNRIAEKYGIAVHNFSLPLFVRGVSAGLNALVKRKRVRQVGRVDGHKHFWEIAV